MYMGLSGTRCICPQSLSSWGYVLKNPSIYNACLLVIITVLYDKRAKFEEDIMLHSDSYAGYLHRVKFRFIPGIY